MMRSSKILKIYFDNIGLLCINIIESPILGTKGNQEFFIALKQLEKLK